ncbi:MAG: dipeptide ABC transporter ATP-binding protein [Alphaproteobacteria bacterium]
MALLDVRDLAVGYHVGPSEMRTAVGGISFSVDRGETVGLVGESGCGKSTVARALLGYFRPGSRLTGGRIAFDGADVTALDPRALQRFRGRRVAYVPQNPLGSLTPHIKAGPQVVEALRRQRGLGAAAARARTLELFAATRLPNPEEAFARYPHELSGGQRQRVVIAAALAGEPDLIVLDEPTTALDKTTEMRVLALVKELTAGRGTALVYISHDLDVVSYMCDRVIVMLGGKVVEEGPTARVYGSPSSDYTRALIAAIPRLDGPRLDGPRLDGLRLDGPEPAKQAAAPAGPPLLSVRGLGYTFRSRGFLGFGRGRPGHVAVSGLSFDLAPGETLGLVGESGSGKSTVANMVAGLLTPTEGEIRFDGQRLAGPAASRPADLKRRIQIVFQDPLSSLNPRQRVGTILMRPLQVFFGMTGAAARARAAELLAAMELPADALDRFPRQLSGGQQQRVAVARAFAAEPGLILCDEVTSALDVSVQAHVLALLKAMQRRTGAACLFISHDLGVIRQVADRVIVLERGLVCDAGTPQAVFARPTHPYTRLLLEAARRGRAQPQPAA